MRIDLQDGMTYESLLGPLQEKFPEYKVAIKKNPLAKFEYIEVRKTGYVGVWLRIFPKKNRVQLTNCIPSTAARAFLGGLLLIAFTYGAQTKVRKQVGQFLIEKYNTREQ